jgi:hypothetical protein
MARRQLARGRVGCAIAHPTLHVVSTRLSHACSGNILIALVDGVLHLLQELINVDQIVLGADVGHGRKMVCGSMTTARAVATTTTGNWNGSRHGLVLGNRAIQDRKLKGLETEQALTDSRIGVGIELASLEVTEEFVQSIVPTLAVVRLGAVMALAQRIVDIAIRMRVGGRRRRVRLVVLGSSMSVGGARNTSHGSLKVMRGSSVSWTSISQGVSNALSDAGNQGEQRLARPGTREGSEGTQQPGWGIPPGWIKRMRQRRESKKSKTNLWGSGETSYPGGDDGDA